MTKMKSEVGIIGKCKLREHYGNDYDHFEEYDSVYNIAKRLGFKSAEDVWIANPEIQPSLFIGDIRT